MTFSNRLSWFCAGVSHFISPDTPAIRGEKSKPAGDAMGDGYAWTGDARNKSKLAQNQVQLSELEPSRPTGAQTGRDVSHQTSARFCSSLAPSACPFLLSHLSSFFQLSPFPSLLPLTRLFTIRLLQGFSLISSCSVLCLPV